MAKRKKDRGRRVGKELGRLVGRLEREARVAARRGKEMQSTARTRSVRWLRRGAWVLNKLALQVEKAGRGSRRRTRGRAKRTR